MAINFKSSGVRVGDRSLDPKSLSKKIPDIGIKTPLSTFQGRQIFDMHDDPRAQLKDNLRNLILTNRGERLGLYNFGANLSELLFDFVALENIESEIAKRIETSVEIFFPGMVIDEITAVELDRNEKNEVNNKAMVKIRLRILYSVPRARINNQALEVTLQNAG